MSDEFYDIVKDKELNIETLGRNDDYSDTHRYPYEPTAYSVLDRVIESEMLSKDDIVIDFGCGMGRVPIYLNCSIGCRTIGIEMFEEFYKKALLNQSQYLKGTEVAFYMGRAEQCVLPDNLTACFMFNPFDVSILRGVIANLIKSYHKNPRQIKLFFYYPSDEYVAYLMSVPELEFWDEIDCMDLFPQKDERNRVIVFETVL